MATKTFANFQNQLTNKPSEKIPDVCLFTSYGYSQKAERHNKTKNLQNLKVYQMLQCYYMIIIPLQSIFLYLDGI